MTAGMARRSGPEGGGVRDGSSSSSGPGPSAQDAQRGVSLLGRLGLAGRTGFYVILTGITIEIAPPRHGSSRGSPMFAALW